MALLTRRRVSSPAQPPALDAATRERLQKQIDNPSTGDLMRRALRRKLAGVVAVGPTDLHPKPPPEPTREDEILARKHDAGIVREHREAVQQEIAAIERRIEDITARVEATAPGTRSYELNEALAERRQLRELIADLQTDGPPAARLPSGRVVDAALRRAIAAEARAQAKDSWQTAERFAAAGDHREARRHRVDAHRARLLVEYRWGLRTSLRGYGLAAWT